MWKKSLLLVGIILFSVGVGAAPASFEDSTPVEGDDIPKVVTDNVRSNMNTSQFTWEISELSREYGKATFTGPANETAVVWVQQKIKWGGVSYKLQPDDGALYIDGRFVTVDKVERNGKNWLTFSVELTGEKQTFEYVNDNRRVNRSSLGPDLSMNDVSFNKSQSINNTSFRVSNRSGVTEVNSTTRPNELMLTITSDVNESKTFYIPKEDVVAATNGGSNLSNVALMLEGSQVSYTIVEQDGQEWVAFTVDHFSTRTARFVAVTGGGGTYSMFLNLSVFGIPLWAIGIGGVVVLALGGYKFYQSRQPASVQYH